MVGQKAGLFLMKICVFVEIQLAVFFISLWLLADDRFHNLSTESIPIFPWSLAAMRCPRVMFVAYKPINCRYICHKNIIFNQVIECYWSSKPT